MSSLNSPGFFYASITEMTTYENKHKLYYERHKEEILAKEKEKKRWKEYYERNKESIKQRRKDRKEHRIPIGTQPNIIELLIV